MRPGNWNLVMMGSLALSIGSCHSATIYVQRRSSGATERDHQFVPRLGPDNHYITFPAYPFPNCADVLFADADEPAHSGARNPTHNGAHNPRLVGQTPCVTATAYNDFTGYKTAELHAGDDRPGRVTWINEYSDLKQPEAVAALLHAGAAAPGGRHAASDVWPQAVLSFLHFSDAQIREPEAKLGGNALSKLLDGLIQSFERNYEQELYSRFVYGAIVDTANYEIREVDDPVRPAPAFMIHTGDSVDMGLQSEFDEFRLFSDQLDVPWYQVIGNHDILAFGNLRMRDPMDQRRYDKAHRPGLSDRCHGEEWEGKHCSCTRLADLVREYQIPRPDNLGATRGTPYREFSLLPALIKRICLSHDVAGDRFVMDPQEYGNTINSFIASHCRPGQQVCNPHRPRRGRYASRPPAGGQEKLCATVQGDDPSSLNGFDLGPYPELRQLVTDKVARGRDNELRSAKKSDYGYYCFEIELPAEPRLGRRAWAVVLNTSSPSSGAFGELRPKQRAWLRDVLASRAAGDLVLVYAHHPLWNIADEDARDEVIELLTAHPGVVGYFTGHTHKAELRLVHPAKEHEHDGRHHHFWEVTAASVIEYPQQAAQVTLKVMGELGYFEVLSFSPSGTGESQAKIELARAGARRDQCHQSAASCVDGVPRLPSRTATFPRLFFRLPPHDGAPAATAAR